MGRVIKFSATIEISGCVLGYLGTVVANVDQGNEPLRREIIPLTVTNLIYG